MIKELNKVLTNKFELTLSRVLYSVIPPATWSIPTCLIVDDITNDEPDTTYNKTNIGLLRSDSNRILLLTKFRAEPMLERNKVWECTARDGGNGFMTPCLASIKPH